MAKRRSDVGHLSKEEYESLSRREEKEPGGESATKASKDVLSRRRIVKVSSKWKKGGGLRTPSAGMPKAPVAALTPTNASSSTGNPFANTSFAPTVKTLTPAPAPAAGTSNPFASVSFATTPVNTTNTFGFSSKGPIATSTKKTKKAPQGTSTTSMVSSSNISTLSKNDDDATSLTLRPGAKKNEVIEMSETTNMNLTMLRMVQKEVEQNPTADHTPWMKTYLSKVSASENSETVNAIASASVSAPKIGNGATASTTSDKSAAPAPAFSSSFSFTSASKDTTTNSTSASTPKFSFSSAPSSSGPGGAAKFTGFSFASSPTPAPAMPAAPKSVPAPTPAPAQQEATTTAPKDPNDESDSTAAAFAPAELPEGEEELFHCQAKYMKLEASEEGGKKEWKSKPVGVLRLYRNSSNNSSKLVIRNRSGIVQLNIPIAKGNPIEKVDKKSKKETGYIHLMSVEKEEVGPEAFMLVMRKEHVDKCFDTLQMLAK